MDKDKNKNVMEKVKTYWIEKDKKFKRNFTISAVLLALAVGTFGYLYSKDSYEFLLSTSDTTMANNVIKKLKDEGIKYKVNGKDIYVANVATDALKLEISGDGTLESPTTEVDWSSTTLFISETQQEKLVQKDLESSLESAIKSYNEIKEAKVLLTLGVQSSFKNENTPSKAAVQLNLKSTLSAKQIDSIQQFVAASVPNLDVADVVITDTNNNLLSGSSDTTLEDNDAYTKNLEKNISANIQDLLSVAYPDTTFKVVSRVEVNFDSTTIEKQSVSSGPDTIVSQETTSEKRYEDTAGGTAGTNSNVPAYETTPDKNKTVYEKNSEVINYELNKVNEQIIKSPEISKLSVAVTGNKTLTQDEIDKITDLVETAALIDESRGDKVSVQGFEVALAEEKPESFFKANLETIVDKSILVLILIVILILALKIISLFKKDKVKIEESVIEDSLSEDVENTIGNEQQEQIDPVTGETIISDTNIGEFAMNYMTPESKKRRDAIEREISENPGQVANVLKAWQEGA